VTRLLFGCGIGAVALSLAAAEATLAQPRPSAGIGASVPMGAAWAAAAGSFTLDAARTKVTNTHQGELTIEAAGRKAHFKASSGAIWESDYSWTIPTTLTPGKNATVTISETILYIKPEQPIRDYMVFRGPDIAKQLIVEHPNPSHGTLTTTFPISSGYASSKELIVSIEFISSSVEYHYVAVPATGGDKGGTSSCSVKARTLFGVRAAADKQPKLNHGKLGVGLVAAPEEKDDRELVEVIKSFDDLGGVYTVDTPLELFGSLHEIKKNVKPIDTLVIGGHGSGGKQKFPTIELAGESLGADDVDLDGIRAQLEKWRAKPQTKIAKDEVCRLEAKIAYLEGVSDAMAKDATVLLINCSTLSTPAGRKFVQNLGEILLSKRGGTIIASKTDVQYGKPGYFGTAFNILTLGIFTGAKNFISFLQGEIDWSDVNYPADAKPGQAFIKGKFQAFRINPHKP
jgi:hypothetical protein